MTGQSWFDLIHAPGAPSTPVARARARHRSAERAQCAAARAAEGSTAWLECGGSKRSCDRAFVWYRAGMFVVVLTYLKPLPEVDRHMRAHVKFLTEHYSARTFIASGRQGRTGGIIPRPRARPRWSRSCSAIRSARTASPRSRSRVRTSQHDPAFPVRRRRRDQASPALAARGCRTARAGCGRRASASGSSRKCSRAGSQRSRRPSLIVSHER